MGFSVKRKKNSGMTVRSFTYTGDLSDCIMKAQKELEKKRNSEELSFLRWQADKAKKELEKYENRIDDLTVFIREARKRLLEEQAEKEGGDHDRRPD